MKNHLLSLINPENRPRTLILFGIAIFLLLGSMIIGITDNLPGISMLLSGEIFLFFSVLHIWKKAMNYAILTISSIAVLILEYLAIYILASLNLERYLSEAAAMVIAFMICVPGILVGIIGSVICSVRKG